MLGLIVNDRGELALLISVVISMHSLDTRILFNTIKYYVFAGITFLSCVSKLLCI